MKRPSIRLIALAACLWAPLAAAQPQGAPVPNQEVDSFAAARAVFVQRATQAHPGKTLNLYPEALGDPRDTNEFKPLRIGNLYPWQATADRQMVLKVFTDAEGGVAGLSDGLAQALAAGPVDREEPGLAHLLAAAGVGSPTAAPTGEVVKRLKFLFDFGTFGRFCPVVTDGTHTRYRWQMKVLVNPQSPGMNVPARAHWISLDFDAAGPKARLTTGTEGC